MLYDGPFSGLDTAVANGKSVLANGACIREGFVLRPAVERFDLTREGHNGLGRVLVKLVGEDFHLRKDG